MKINTLYQRILIQTPYSKRKYQETEKDEEALETFFKISNKSGDGEIKAYLEARAGLREEKKSILNQAHSEANKENERIDSINIAAFKLFDQYLGVFNVSAYDVDATREFLSSSPKRGTFEDNIDSLIDSLRNKSAEMYKVLQKDIPNLEPEDCNTIADKIESLLKATKEAIKENEAMGRIRNRIKGL